jgi:hypothetical protein
LSCILFEIMDVKYFSGRHGFTVIKCVIRVAVCNLNIYIY